MAEAAAPEDRFGLTGTTLAGRYHVEVQIAEGGFAVVYRAYQVALDRLVALKVLKTPPGLDEAARTHFRERFASEAKTIARLKHPYVVAVHDFGVSQMASGELAPWMALEWLGGETLENDLDRRRGAGGRSPAESVLLLRSVIDALAYAHRQGVVHRDIKPANMMLVAAENGRVLRMLDFGIAKIMRAGQVEGTKRTGTSGTPAFSPDYAAPEQVTFSRTGPWTDVHALGLVLTEILTDQSPYLADSDEHVFEQVMSRDRPTPRRKGKNVGRLEKIIEKAVALSPRQRWKNAGELLQAIDAVAFAREPEAKVRRASPRTKAKQPEEISVPTTKRVIDDRIVAAVGGVMVLGALGVLAWTLAENSRFTISVSEEFALATLRSSLHGRGHRPSGRPSAAVAPWIVPIPAERPASSAVVPPIEPAPARHPKAASIGPGAPRVEERRVPVAARALSDLSDTATAKAPLCKITVNSIPWSEVWIDGKNTGKHTPLVDHQIACGRHRIEFKRPDLEIDQSESVVVTADVIFKRWYTLTSSAPAK